jgi:hypothetical protein
MAFAKGHQKIGGRAKGTPNYETLTRLERKTQFDRLAAQRFESWIDTCRPEYGLDRFLGKLKDEIEVEQKHELSPRIKHLADMIVAVEKGTYVPADPNYDPLGVVMKSTQDDEN